MTNSLWLCLLASSFRLFAHRLLSWIYRT